MVGDSDDSRTVLVTGASGYIGRHIVANLLSKGTRVRATVRDSSDPERVDHLESLSVSDGGHLEIVEMDLLDREYPIQCYLPDSIVLTMYLIVEHIECENF